MLQRCSQTLRRRFFKIAKDAVHASGIHSGMLRGNSVGPLPALFVAD